jgi:hypothetical protein
MRTRRLDVDIYTDCTSGLGLGTSELLLYCRLPEEQYVPDGPALPSLLVQRPVLLVDIVLVLIVDMNERPLDIAQAFELPLQRLAHVIVTFSGRSSAMTTSTST